jgi:hypothetical protein
MVPQAWTCTKPGLLRLPTCSGLRLAAATEMDCERAGGRKESSESTPLAGRWWWPKPPPLASSGAPGLGLCGGCGSRPPVEVLGTTSGPIRRRPPGPPPAPGGGTGEAMDMGEGRPPPLEGAPRASRPAAEGEMGIGSAAPPDASEARSWSRLSAGGAARVKDAPARRDDGTSGCGGRGRSDRRKGL